MVVDGRRPRRGVCVSEMSVDVKCRERVLAEPGNIPAGRTVPKTGTYKCEYCGPKGAGAQVLKIAMQKMGMPYVPPYPATRKKTHAYFEQGTVFPKCPNCTDEKPENPTDCTGWTFVSEKRVRGAGYGDTPSPASRRDRGGKSFAESGPVEQEGGPVEQEGGPIEQEGGPVELDTGLRVDLRHLHELHDQVRRAQSVGCGGWMLAIVVAAGSFFVAVIVMMILNAVIFHFDPKSDAFGIVATPPFLVFIAALVLAYLWLRKKGRKQAELARENLQEKARVFAEARPDFIDKAFHGVEGLLDAWRLKAVMLELGILPVGWTGLPDRAGHQPPGRTQSTGPIGTSDVPVCDTCGKRTGMTKGKGYVLTTRQVIISPDYWEGTFRAWLAATPMRGAELFDTLLARQCSQSTGWTVCDECIGKFPHVDRGMARAYADQFWQDQDGDYSPPGGGSVDVDVARESAVEGWRRSGGSPDVG